VPNRILREGLIHSPAVNAVSERAELLYIHIITSADDFGLIEFGPLYLKSRCVPGRTWNAEEIAALCVELEREALVRTYDLNGKRYAAVTKWEQRRFAKAPKCPMPPWGDDHIRGGYVDPRVREPTAPANLTVARMRAGGEWWKSDDGIRAKFIELGLKPLPGESLKAAKERCFEELDRRKRA
jgi:hypothetical protein